MGLSKQMMSETYQFMKEDIQGGIRGRLLTTMLAGSADENSSPINRIIDISEGCLDMTETNSLPASAPDAH